MDIKLKECSFCGNMSKLFYSRPKCCSRAACLMQYKNLKHEEKEKSKSGSGTGKTKPKQSSEKTRYSSIRPKPRKSTGELKMFLKIYAERKGKCEITGELIKFDVNNFAHILSKGAYPSFRLNPDNIAHVKPDIHRYYDGSDKETLLKHFPEAEVIYQKKVILKREYYEQTRVNPKNKET